MSSIDWDLEYCLEYNPQSFCVNDIYTVMAIWEGEYDGDSWRWIIQLNDGRFVFLHGSCDYTGWDCQSNAESYFADSAIEAADFVLTIEPRSYSWVDLSIDLETIHKSLLDQIKNGKAKTWRELKDEEFGLDE